VAVPKVACLCGFVHNLSPCPDEGWITVRDKEYESLIADHIAYEAGDKEVADRIWRYWGRIYECPKCGRLMWTRPGNHCVNFEFFRREEPLE
jgi:hypothetical protein